MYLQGIRTGDPSHGCRTVLTTELSSRRRRVLTGDVTGLPAGTHNHEGGGGGGGLHTMTS